MKLYAVVEKLYCGVKIIAICTDLKRAQEIEMQKQDEGQDAQIVIFEDGHAKPSAYCFNQYGEFEGYVTDEKEGIFYQKVNPDGVVVLADTMDEAERKALELLEFCQNAN